MISFMKHSVYIVPRCYGQDDYLIPCAKSDLDGRVPRLSPRLVGGWGQLQPTEPQPSGIPQKENDAKSVKE